MKLFFNLILTLSVFLTFACKKNDTKDYVPVIDKNIPVKDTVPTTPPPLTGRTIDMGTGSGELVIDGSTLSLQCNDRIRIAKGSYKKITIKNIQASTGCSIQIVNNGLVEIAGDYNQMNLSNLKGVIISGNGDPSIPYGFQFHDNASRSIDITKPFNDCTIQNVSFKNIKSWIIIYNNTDTYNGSADSYSRNLKFLNISCENTARLINFPGSAENGANTGLIRGLEIANLNFRNSSTAGSVVWVGNVEDYSIHHNRIDNINSANNEHNGIFQMMGNGKFYNNYISNHQGNAIRAWCYAVGSTPKEILIYNNIVVNSRKYSAFEVQTIQAYVNPALTYCNVKVYNNTCGNLNLSKDWYGNLVDVYTLQGGTCQVFNNIGFNFPGLNPVDKISNQQGPTKPEDLGNLYFNSSAEVGFSNEEKYTLSSTSPAKNKGKSYPLLTTDYYDIARKTSSPSYGAVE
jgi:hypothetical protein